MKKLLLLIVTALTLTVGFASQVQAATPNTFWKVELFQPQLSETNHNLNIAYNVFSINDTDSQFTVKLYQNNGNVGTQFISHPNGNSGAFSVSLPENGTYSYYVVASITAGPNNGSQLPSQTQTVNIVNGPSPAVHTVTVNTASAPTGTTPATTGSSASSEGTGAGTGTTSQTSTSNSNAGATSGQVTDQAANTNKNTGTALGASTTKTKASNKKWYWGIGGVIALGAAIYYWFFYRARSV